MKKKTIAIALACAVLLCCVVGGTMAWLTDSTPTVTNTFTVGDINIDLTETGAADTDDTTEGILDKAYHFVPGDKLVKDPVITVEKGSEKCYLFLQVTEVNNSVDGLYPILNWDVRDLNTDAKANPEEDWVVYSTANGVTNYYRIVDAFAATEDIKYYVLTGEGDGELKNGMVSVSTAVRKDMVTKINAAKPTLSFKAAAVQHKNIADEDEAFAQTGW